MTRTDMQFLAWTPDSGHISGTWCIIVHKPRRVAVTALTNWIEGHTPTWFAKAGDPNVTFARTVAVIVVVVGTFMIASALVSALLSAL